MPDAASGFFNVTFTPRYQMDVTVEDCLPSILSTVYAYVEPSHCGVFWFY
ncbi:hypothetical protein N9H25_01305 [Porticoccaceae bacterium]|nr:hypothetical protein [Porticoccaceae bacterium]